MFRNIILFVSIVFVIVVASGCVTAGKGGSLSMTEGAEIRTYEVFGMDCPVCHGGVEKRLMKIRGVEHANANWQDKQIEVVITSGEEVTDESISQAVKQANFTIGERIK